MLGFVGRSGELLALESALEDAVSGRGHLFFLVGEAGIGKTRLADELCSRAGKETRVLWGRAWEAGGAPAFWPWIEILRPLVAEGDAATLAQDFGPDAASLAALLPELRTRLPGLAAQPPSESPGARFLLFDALARFLRARAARRPLLLVLDDLHVADEPSLRLLEFMARGLRGSRVLIVGTYRDADPGLSPERAQLLANIARDAERIAMKRLGGDEVAEFIEKASGTVPARDVVDAIVRVTEGTPLFVTEVVGLVTERGLAAVSMPAGRVVVPDGLGPAIRGHLARVSDETRKVLRAAAILGRDFGVAPLETLLDADGTPVSDVGAELAEAAQAGIVTDLNVEPPRFRFSHILVRETIYGDLGAAARERLHGKAAEALADAAARASLDGLGFAELAHHFLRAGALVRDRAAQYSRLAGEHALGIYAHEQAVTHFRQALGALPPDGPNAGRARVELLLSLAEACSRGGDRARANEASEQAARAAEALGDWELFARAALQRGREFTFGLVDATLVRLLETVLSARGGEETALRARLMARLAAARQPAPDPEKPLALAREAIALVRTTGDRRALGAVLRDARAAFLPMDSLEERLVLDLETLAIAYETGDQLAALHAQRRLSWDRLEEGQVTAARAHFEQCARIAEEMREPHRHWWSVAGQLTGAVLIGAFAEADRLLAELESMTGASSDPSAADYVGIQKATLVWTARRDAELALVDEAMARELARTPTPMLAFFRAVTRHRMGDVDYVRKVWPDLLGAYRHPRFWGQHHFAEMAIAVGDDAWAADTYERLLPWGDRFVAHLAFEGSYARTLGIVAHGLGRTDAARRHFEAAISLEEGIGARPWIAHSLVAYARALRTTGNDRDRRKASELMSQAGAIARELGMPGILALLPLDAGPKGSSFAEGARTASDLSEAFKLEGEYWTVSFGDERLRLKDSKGLQLVAYLVENPDREFHVLHLVGVADKQPGASMLVENAAPAAPDAAARAAYKRRLDDLREELEDAETRGDIGRAERAREEIDLLGDEIGRGLGLGGRERGTGGSVERARINVQRRISDALAKIGAACPTLGRHLSSAIRTGTYCSYART